MTDTSATSTPAAALAELQGQIATLEGNVKLWEKDRAALAAEVERCLMAGQPGNPAAEGEAARLGVRITAAVKVIATLKDRLPGLASRADIARLAELWAAVDRAERGYNTIRQAISEAERGINRARAEAELWGSQVRTARAEAARLSESLKRTGALTSEGENLIIKTARAEG